MTLKNWQTDKKSNTAQKKGANKGKPVAKKPASAKKPEPTAQVAKPSPEADAAPEALETAEHAEPRASEETADEVLVVYEPTETDGAAVEVVELAAEEVEVEQVEPVEPEADETALTSEPEVEAATTGSTPAVEPAQPEPAAAEAEAAMMAMPEGTQAAEEAQKPEETPVTEKTQAAESAPIPEAEVATEQPAAAPAPATSASAEGETKPASKKAQPRERDPRLPPPGTVLQRRDRHGNVRCESTVEEDGIRYNGTLYKSLSAAAIAATKDLGLKSETQNGPSFWQLTKPARPAKNVLESLERAWERYREHAEAAAAQNGASEEERRPGLPRDREARRDARRAPGSGGVACADLPLSPCSCMSFSFPPSSRHHDRRKARRPLGEPPLHGRTSHLLDDRGKL